MGLKELPVIEQKIIRRFLDNIDKTNKDRATAVVVYGEGDDAPDFVGTPDRRAEIEAAIGITEITIVEVCTAGMTGRAYFAHGEGEDLIFNTTGDAKRGLEMIEALLAREGAL